MIDTKKAEHYTYKILHHLSMMDYYNTHRRWRPISIASYWRHASLCAIYQTKLMAWETYGYALGQK